MTRSEPDQTKHQKEDRKMKKEDIWMVVVVAFSIIWVIALGLGLLG